MGDETRWGLRSHVYQGPEVFGSGCVMSSWNMTTFEDIEACDVSLKDNTPLELPDNEQNDLWNITNDVLDDDNNITDMYNTKLLGPGDAPPSNAGLGEVEL